MRRKTKIPFEIDETPPSPGAFREADQGDYLGAIERDTRDLIRRLAERECELKEAAKKHEAHTRALLLALVDDLSDAFERVFDIIQKQQEHLTPKTKIWFGNFRTIYRLLQQILSTRGVTPIANLDEGFDPDWHKAVEIVKDPAREDGAIVQEVRRGYVWGDKVLRKSEVVVVRNTDDGEAGPQEDSVTGPEATKAQDEPPAEENEGKPSGDAPPEPQPEEQGKGLTPGE